MEKIDYWGKIDQSAKFALDFERPEQKQLAGKLLIVGGHANSFFSVARATQVAGERGVGEVLTVLPDSLEKKVPNADGIMFLKSESSGGFAKSNLDELSKLSQSADSTLFLGDMGRNAEVKELMSRFLEGENSGMTLLARDAVDLALDSEHMENWLQQENSELFLTMGQFKKLLQAVYYPRVLNLTMPLLQIVETLHKFTVSYEATIIVLQAEHVLIARGGRVLTVALSDMKYNTMTIFDGELMVNILRLQMWNQGVKNRLESIAAACLDK